MADRVEPMLSHIGFGGKICGVELATLNRMTEQCQVDIGFASIPVTIEGVANHNTEAYFVIAEVARIGVNFEPTVPITNVVFDAVEFDIILNRC